MLAGNAITLLFSEESIDEFIEVAQRAKFKKYFTTVDLEDLLKKIRDKAEIISVTTVVHLCRDVKDNFLLALAQDGNATHLLTGDKDLLVLKKVGKTKILTITDYISKKYHKSPAGGS
jgi:putative PIN family toxin of toxin-antitoxin system